MIINHWLAFGIIVLFILYKIHRSADEDDMGLHSALWIIVLLAFIPIWGGIFWW